MDVRFRPLPEWPYPPTREQAYILARVRVQPDGCWRWRLHLTRDGYGRCAQNGRMVRAHRRAYEAFVGPISDGLVPDHLCRNRWCVNPAHLELVTVRENTLRGDTIAARNAAHTHCPAGHEFTPENTKLTTQGARRCRTCAGEQSRKYKARRRQEARHILEGGN